MATKPANTPVAHSRPTNKATKSITNRVKQAKAGIAAESKHVEVKAKIKSGHMRGRSVTVLMDTDDIVKEHVGGFVQFLREHAIVGLAVGFVVGTQSQAVVKQLITSFIDPAFMLFFGGTELSKRTFTLHLWKNHANFGWGAMAYALINVLFVLAVIYALIKILKLDKLDAKKDASKVEAITPDAKKAATAKKTSKKKPV